MRYLACLVAAAGLVPVVVTAEETTAQSDAILEPSCADLMAALRVADPGKKPSRKHREDALAAQDDIATALFWLHGWHHAQGRAKLPVTRAWLATELKRVVEACNRYSPDGSMLVSEAAKR